MTTLVADRPPAGTERWHRPRLTDLLDDPGFTAVVSATSRDPNAKLVVVLLDARTGQPRLAVKVPTTETAVRAIAAEAEALQAIADCLEATPLLATVPRVVGWVASPRGPAMVTTAVEGVPLNRLYHRVGHIRDPRAVGEDLRAIGDWLSDFQARTAGRRRPISMGVEVRTRLAHRFSAVAGIDEVLARLAVIDEQLARASTPETAVHGDLWHGNVFVTPPGGGRALRVTGVVDWENAAVRGEPLRDVARSVLAYALYLDRHTRAGRPVRGHPGLWARSWGDGLRYAIAGNGWFPALVRGVVRSSLRRLGADEGLVAQVLVAGVAEMAASADHDGFARAHLAVLADLLGAPSGGSR